jgi:hypothetical protein
MIDLIFFKDRPTVLGEASRETARGIAIAKLIARHQDEFGTLLQHEMDTMLYEALHAMEMKGAPYTVTIERTKP